MRIGRLIIYVVFFLIISFLIVRFDLVSYDYFVKTEFLFTFLGVFIGFALTLYTYITSMFEKMQDIIRIKYKDNPIELKSRISELPKLHTEIKDNIMYLFYVLIIVVVLSVGDKMLLKLNCFWSEFQYIPKSILLTIFILSILALKDLIVTSFAISDFIIKGNSEE
jgi:hypothetical protein